MCRRSEWHRSPKETRHGLRGHKLAQLRNLSTLIHAAEHAGIRPSGGCLTILLVHYCFRIHQGVDVQVTIRRGAVNLGMIPIQVFQSFNQVAELQRSHIQSLDGADARF